MNILVIMICILIGIIMGSFCTGRWLSKITRQYKKASDKVNARQIILYRMLCLKQRGISIADIFERKGYRNVLIYGTGIVGELIYDELKDTQIKTVGIIDRKAGCMSADYPYPLISPTDELPNEDCIAVAETYFFDEIKNDMQKKTDIPIESLEDLLFDLSQE